MSMVRSLVLIVARPLALFLVAVLGAPFWGGTDARAQSPAVWELKAGASICRVVFVQGPIAPGIQRLQVNQPCTGIFSGFIGWSSAQNGQRISLYGLNGGQTALAARADRERPGSYIGQTIAGVSFTMVMPKATGAVPPTPARPPVAEVKPNPACRVMRDSGTCAQANDIGPPRFPPGLPKKSSITPIVKLDIRFLPNSASQPIGQADREVCIQVTECRASSDGTVWCETTSGNFTGWVLKQDKNFVYARNGCG